MTALRSLSLFNTLTRMVEPIVPVEPGVVRIYNCGPTVYDFAHIGNLRTFLFQDLLRRTLNTLGYRVLFCMNITDVEDKIIAASQKGLPEDASQAVRHAAMAALTQGVTERFLEDLAEVGIAPPTFMPRATEYIPHMLALVQKLMDKGLAYEREGSVYYRVAGFSSYGKLARLASDGMKVGASGVDLDEYEKDCVQDFVLWKAAKPGEPHWLSPWGEGRPGWHIECSAMGIDKLGECIDIHTGGVDLIFPHHTNEVAQSEGCLGHRWVNLWCHGEFLLVEGQKMSKSLGNFFTLRDLMERGVDPRVFRYAILSNHYRKVLNFSFEGLRAAEAALQRVGNFRKRMEAVPLTAASHPELQQWLTSARERFWQALCDDLNTPEALAVLFTLISELNAEDDRSPLTVSERQQVLALLDEADAVFGGWPHQEAALDTEVEALIAARQAARKARNFTESDRLRDELKARGVVLEDRKDGSVAWRRE